MKISLLTVAVSAIVLLVSCKPTKEKKDSEFALARKQFNTKLVKQYNYHDSLAVPPDSIFSIVKYPSSVGNLAAYLSKLPTDGKLHPAIIWIEGGFGNGVSEVWEEVDSLNDQTGGVFRKAGIVMMYPTQRGAQNNPGYDESGYGEVDDIIAAARFLRKQPGVDSNRIYLAGHSTGGTKVLLATEASYMFRATFSFGPVTFWGRYGDENITYDESNNKESDMRAPYLWLKSIQTPVYIMEGADDPCNIDALKALKHQADMDTIPLVHFYEVRGKDHFSILQPLCKVIATKIIEDAAADKPEFDMDKIAYPGLLHVY